MLYSIKVRNFQSFLEEVHISMEMSQHVPNDDRSFGTVAGKRLSKAMAIIGLMQAVRLRSSNQWLF
jgi:hypothetical protein